MKLKYYLRGVGIGIIVTTIILMIAYSGHKTELTNEEIIKRAEKLGMVMKEDTLFSNSEMNRNSEMQDVSEQNTEQGTEQTTEQTSESESEAERETEKVSESVSEVTAESESEAETERTSESESNAAASGEVYRLVISSGMVPRLICNDLEENGVIESAAELRQYLVDVGYVTSIIAGEYDIPYGAANDEIYQILKAGPIKK